MKAFKMIIILIVFVIFFGCSQKYVARTDKELLDRKVFARWDDLDSRIVNRSEKSFCLNLKVMRFIEVRDSLKISQLYRRGSKNRDGKIEQSSSSGCARVLLGGVLSVSSMYLAAGLAWAAGWAGSSGSSCINWGSWGALAGCFLGTAVSLDGLSEIGYKSMEVLPLFAKVDTVCVDSVSLSFDSVAVRIEDSDFKNKYLTDSFGNINLQFDEILTEPAEKNSVPNLIIQYEDLIDTVEVKIGL